MKFSIFTVMLPEYHVSDAVVALARHGYDGVEWRVKNTSPDARGEKPSYWGNNLCTIEQDSLLDDARRIRDLTEREGLVTSALACYHTVDNLAETERALEAARIMGAKIIRVNAFGYDGTKPYDDLFKSARRFYGESAMMARAAGVKVCVETHMGQIAPSASAARRLLDGLDPDCVGVIYDPGNMVTEGQEQTKMGLEILGPYLAHVHAKNGAWTRIENPKPGEHPWAGGIGAPLDEGIADWRKIIAALKAVGYDGWISFEDFSSGRTTEEKVKFNIEYLKSLL